MKKAAYSEEYFPVAPVLPVSVVIPGGAPAQDEMALIDTGADGTFVPTPLLEKMDLPISHMTNVRSHLGDKLYRVPVHKVDMILFGSIRLPGIDVVGDDWGDRIILGRNVLNMLDLRLNGPIRVVGVQE